MLWVESISQWLTGTVWQFQPSLGSSRLNLTQSQSRAKLRPLPSTAWTGNQLQMQTLKEGECFRRSTVLTRTRPRSPRSLPAQWTFFWARGQGEGQVSEDRGSCGSLNKVGYRSVVLVNQIHSGIGVTLHGWQTAHHYHGNWKKLICMHTCSSFTNV